MRAPPFSLSLSFSIVLWKMFFFFFRPSARGFVLVVIRTVVYGRRNDQRERSTRTVRCDRNRSAGGTGRETKHLYTIEKMSRNGADRRAIRPQNLDQSEPDLVGEDRRRRKPTRRRHTISNDRHLREK